MGTRGYVVWRYRKIYRVQYNHRDSYPQGLGLSLLKEIPNGGDSDEYSDEDNDEDNAEDFKQWVKERRSWFNSEYNDWLARQEDSDDSDSNDSDRYERDGDISFQTDLPANTLFIEWVYEIDLDNLVFHVDSMPLFRLDRMPNQDTFIKSIGYDNYGVRHYNVTTPEEHRYESILAERALRPVAKKLLRRYNTLKAQLASTSDVLKFPLTDSPQTRLAEFMIAQLALQQRCDVFEWRAASCWEDVEQISDFAYSLLGLAIWPKLIPGDAVARVGLRREELDGGYWWPTGGLCVRLVPQLQDEDTMKAAIAEVADTILSKDIKSTSFGILFNVLHVCILRVSYQGRKRVIEHTQVLPFLPSFLATTTQTDGISAIAALAQLLHRNIVPGAIDKPSSPDNPTLLDKLPIELLGIIGEYLDVESLCSFASLSDKLFEGCLPILKSPFVSDARLIATRREEEEALTKEELPKTGDGSEPLTCLVSARFSVDTLSICQSAPLAIPSRIVIAMPSTSFRLALEFRSNDGVIGIVSSLHSKATLADHVIHILTNIHKYEPLLE